MTELSGLREHNLYLSLSSAHLRLVGSRKSFDDMQCNAALLEGKVTLHRKGMARRTERGETRSALAHANVAREEARVVTRAALEDAAHPCGRRRVRGEGQGHPRAESIARAEERVKVRGREVGEACTAARGGRGRRRRLLGRDNGRGRGGIGPCWIGNDDFRFFGTARRRR
jgi:hypothetical protein